MADNPVSVKTPAPQHIAFAVPGKPVSQGSMRSPRAGVVLHDKLGELKAWRQIVGLKALQAYHGPVHDGPVQVGLDFAFRTPRKHRGKTLKHTQPDLDKLIRAVLDALTGVLYRDDGQVYYIEATKTWVMDGAAEGLGVEVWLQHEAARR